MRDDRDRPAPTRFDAGAALRVKRLAPRIRAAVRAAGGCFPLVTGRKPDRPAELIRCPVAERLGVGKREPGGRVVGQWFGAHSVRHGMTSGGGKPVDVGVDHRPAAYQQGAEPAHACLTGLTQLVVPARYFDKLVQRGERAHGGSLYTAQTSSTGTSLSARESGTQPQRADNLGERLDGVAADERVDVRQCRRHPTERAERSRAPRLAGWPRRSDAHAGAAEAFALRARSGRRAPSRRRRSAPQHLEPYRAGHEGP